ncbi:hypothetical protein DFH28DRAFT_895778 [Melampsora americana]|nr:hypothetical protein DFH28DRAFT_895778 [Melampsora americana]
MAGKGSKRHIRKLPATPIPSVFSKVPKNLPIDFYDPAFFNKLQPGQKRLIANSEEVCFLPNAAQSFLPVPHPDENLHDRKFTAKYLDSVLESYDLTDGSDDEPEEEFSDGDDDADMDNPTSTNLQGEDNNNRDSDFYSEGEYGDLYDDDKDEDLEEDKGIGGSAAAGNMHG